MLSIIREILIVTDDVWCASAGEKRSSLCFTVPNPTVIFNFASIAEAVVRGVVVEACLTSELLRNMESSEDLDLTVHEEDEVEENLHFQMPVGRSRANTWPASLSLLGADGDEEVALSTPDVAESSGRSSHDGGLGRSLGGVSSTTGDEALGENPPSALAGAAAGTKKNSARRNAWGNFSYADLITQAIQNSPEKRLTLSQIYDWMVQNIPFFKDKGDSNSSAGWKVNQIKSVGPE